MFGRDPRQPVDLLLGTDEHEVDSTNWVARYQQRLQDAYQLAQAQLECKADSRKKYYDRQAHDLLLSFGERVYLRKRNIRGRNQIQDVWDSKVYKVVAKKGNNDVYVIEPADGFGGSRTVNQAELRICPQPEKITKRRLPCIPVDQLPTQRRLERTISSSDDADHDNDSAVKQTSSDDDDSAAEEVSDNMTDTSSEVESHVNIPVVWRSSRKTAGQHRNPFREPWSARD
ncbi:hypothetical protein NP493_1379g01024 [Ridgeia piscesae]|uniref:Uncharacterized protein n=1 Tax=Ridgeia piscesae TaxID=27915 RepID=A0AAD9K5P1_RIDPI|nr:hypothetical protein NP493_1379g01024 [Ridgeia piscesae]